MAVNIYENIKEHKPNFHKMVIFVIPTIKAPAGYPVSRKIVFDRLQLKKRAPKRPVLF